VLLLLLLLKVVLKDDGFVGVRHLFRLHLQK
jgi:hypothetical protein